jgi:hypothetical protein
MTIPLAVLFLAAQTFANAVVVSTDANHHKLTFTRNGGPSEELVVDNAAAGRLAGLKPGDEVILTLSQETGLPAVVTGIERSVRGTRARRYRPGQAPSPTASPSPAPRTSPSPKPSVAPRPKASPSTRPPTDTVGPLQDPRKGAQQDPRDNPNRDPRVVPGLTQPPSPVPSPTPTPRP